MVRHINRPILACSIILMAVSLVSCSGGGNLGGGSTGFLELSLIDSPSDYDALFITINEVQVHHEIDGWQTLSDLNLVEPINLLELVGGTMYYLGSPELAIGHYDQLRLILDKSEGSNYLLEENGEGEEDDVVTPLKIPSGHNTGIKLVNGFDIEASHYTELILDFDVDKSVVEAGKSGQHILKPTIKVVESVTNSVSGTVVDAAGEHPAIEDAMVTAQTYSGPGDLPDEADRVIKISDTQSNELGEYFMYLPLLAPTALPYNIVATMEGYAPACQQLPSNDPMGYLADFELDALDGDTGTFSASVVGLGTEESVTISIRQEDTVGDCGYFEVASFNLNNTGETDLITLPTGDYRIVISAEGYATDFVDQNLAAEGFLIEVDFS
ncbi:MAG: DUF4382 domain-containing protein [Acidobacteriota bacterium]|jgi:hypothetical protein